MSHPAANRPADRQLTDSQQAGNPPYGGSKGEASDSAEKKFMERVRRTVFIDNMSPAVPDFAIDKALSQFGRVVHVKLLYHALDPKRPAGAALVEMETEQHANNVVAEFQQKLFMLGGIPRPVWGAIATPDQFPDRPRGRQQRVQAKFLDRSTPAGQAAERKRSLAWRHVQELQVLEEEFQREDKLLAQTQHDQFQREWKKLKLIKDLGSDSGYRELRDMYGMKKPEIY